MISIPSDSLPRSIRSPYSRNCPPAITPTRSQQRFPRSDKMCVEKRIVLPAFFQFQNDVAHFSCAPPDPARTSARPKSASLGSCTIACARPTRLTFLSKISAAESFQPSPGPPFRAFSALVPCARRTEAVEAREIIQHLRCRQIVVKIRLLWQVPDVPVHAHIAYRFAQNLGTSRRRENNPHQQFDGGAFPAPFGPRNPNTSPSSDLHG